MKGFTLVEILIYFGLVGLIMTILVSLYPIFSNLEKNYKWFDLETESQFLIKKIFWALNDSVINEPKAGSSSTVLSLTKNNYSFNPIIFKLVGQNLVISKNNTDYLLNSSKVKVDNLEFFLDNSSNLFIKLKLVSLVDSSASTTININFHLRK